MNKKRAITAIVFVGICAAGIAAVLLMHFIGHWIGAFDAKPLLVFGVKPSLFVPPPANSPLLDGVSNWIAESLLGFMVIITGAGILAIFLVSIYALVRIIWNASGRVSNRIAL